MIGSSDMELSSISGNCGSRTSSRRRPSGAGPTAGASPPGRMKELHFSSSDSFVNRSLGFGADSPLVGAEPPTPLKTSGGSDLSFSTGHV